MAVANQIQNSFTAGELDPKLRARTDIAVFYTGASKLRNVLPLPQGAVRRRPGLEYLADLPLTNIKMYDFTYSGSVSYLMVLTTNLMSIYKEGLLMDTVACTISNAQVPDCTFAHSNDIMLVFHPDFQPKFFLRASDTVWSTGTWNFINVPSYRFTTTPTTTTCSIQASDGSDIDFTTWTEGNTATGIAVAGAPTWAVGDVGKYIRGAGGGYARITGFVTNITVNITILTAFVEDIETTLSMMPAGEWYLEEVVWSSTKGYPRCGAFYQGRLWLASTPSIPTGIWASKVNDEQDFANWIPDFADYGIFLIAKDAKTSFHACHVGRHIAFFSSEAAIYIGTASDEPPIPTNVAVRALSGSYGAEPRIPAFDIGGSTVFMRSGGKSVMEGTYTFAQGAYDVSNLNLLSAHILNGAVSMAYRKQVSTDEADYVMVVNGDGTLSVLCTLRQQEINAWAICETAGNFKYVCTAGAGIYFAIERVIDGTTVVMLERFHEDMMVDCGRINLAVVEQNTLVGMTHLIGEEVQIIVDNTVDNPQTVTGDVITSTIWGLSIQAGLNFPIVDTDTGSRVFIKSMPIDLSASGNSTVGQKKRLSEVTVMLYETSHIIVNRNDVPIRRLGIDHLDSPVPKRSENITVKGILGWDDEINVSISQTLPLPMTLLGMAYMIKA